MVPLPFSLACFEDNLELLLEVNCTEWKERDNTLYMLAKILLYRDINVRGWCRVIE